MQVDGGSENANKCVLALCELYFVKQIANCLVFTRLPTGHSHCDGDGSEGLMKEEIVDVSILTWDEFKRVRLYFAFLLNIVLVVINLLL